MRVTLYILALALGWAGIARAEDDPERPTYAAGAHLRYATVPSFLLGAFADPNVPLHSFAVGGHVVRRSGNLDIVASIDDTELGPPDGNWLGNGHDRSIDTDYVQFRGFRMVSLDVTWIWRRHLAHSFEIEYGAGVGMGFTLGQILRTSDGTPACTTKPGDAKACHPILCAQGPCDEATLARSMTSASSDTSTDPHRFVEGSVPPVVPVVHLLAGAIWQLANELRVRLEGGFKDTLYVGTAIEYVF
jgi:hypothetical protein